MSEVLMLSVEGDDFYLRYLQDEWITMAPACPVCMEFVKEFYYEDVGVWGKCCGMVRELIE